jgi:putative DNA primase/helicase
MAHPFSDFLKYAPTDFCEYILPIIPAGAKLKETSKISADQLGKIPGLYDADAGAWVGFAWPNNRATKKTLEWYEVWQREAGTAIAIALNTALWHGLDVDSDKKEFRDTVWKLADEHFGATPVVRCRAGSVRIVLFYRHEDHTAPIRKFRGAFEDKDGVKHVVEFLARGQQVVIEGPHAKGAMHYWHNGGLIENVDKIPTVTVEKVNTFFRALEDWALANGYVKHKLNLPTGSNRAAAVSITNLSPHRAKDIDLLARAISHIDINDPRLDDYDRWCALFRAMKAACGGDQAFYAEHILPWLLENPENHEEVMQAKWDSFTDSQVGAEFVYRCASQFGFTEGMTAITQELFERTAGDTANAGGDQTNVPSDGGGPAPPPGGPAQPGGPLPFDDRHRAIAEDFEKNFSDLWRYDTKTRQWYQYENGIWRPDPTVIHDIRDITFAMSRRILASVAGRDGAQRSRALESAGTYASVRNILQSSRIMAVDPKSFDRDRHLFNTPDFVVDLRTCQFLDHSPSLLMRHMASVSPDFMAYLGQEYETRCPRWMKFLRTIAHGRPWVIPFLQRWFGYCLSGEMRHQNFLFIQGTPGTGKTQLLLILLMLMGTYALTLPERFIIKGPDKRFDMVKIIGKRMLFADETQKGSTLDETRLCLVASHPVLQAEIKGGEEIEFDATGKLCIAGNHRPHFVSGEAGGLTSRLLLLEMENEPIRGTAADIANFAKQLVEEEGPAVLMWMIEGAIIDSADQDGAQYRELTTVMRDKAMEYTRENSLYWQWIEARCRVEPDAEIDLLEAYEAFKEYVWRTTHERSRDRRTDFRAALKAMLPDLEFSTRTKGQYKGRAYIRGLGFTKINYEDAGNVVDISEKRAEKPHGEEKTSPGEV